MGDLSEEKIVFERQSRVESYSYIRAIACFAIIILHTVHASVLLYGDRLTQTQYLISRVIENCMMWAVPCFLMVTGALLLNKEKEITYRKLFQKYILRIFTALAITCMILRIVDAALEGESFGIYIILDGAKKLFTGSSWAYLWYLYLLIGLYLFLPFYKKIVQNSKDFELKYLVCLYVLFLSLLPILQIWEINCGFYITTASIYPLFLFCGYMLHKKVICLGKVISVFLIVCTTGAIIIFTIIRWKYDIAKIDILLGYASIFVIIQSAGIFSVFEHNVGNGLLLIKKILLTVDECSFGIYLIHMILVKILLSHMEVNPYKMNGSVLAGVILLVFVASYVIVLTLKRWTIFKKIL